MRLPNLILGIAVMVPAALIAGSVLAGDQKDDGAKLDAPLKIQTTRMAMPDMEEKSMPLLLLALLAAASKGGGKVEAAGIRLPQ